MVEVRASSSGRDHDRAGPPALALGEVGLALPIVALVVGAALVALCIYDAPPTETPPPTGPAAPGTERRVAVGMWALVVFNVAGPVVLALMGLPPWPSAIAILPVLVLVTWRQSVAEGVPFLAVLRRAWRR